jgi:hypothetical protein
MLQFALLLGTGWRETPCHISELKKGDVFYMVTDGAKGELRVATALPYSSQVDGDILWRIDSEPYR